MINHPLSLVSRLRVGHWSYTFYDWKGRRIGLRPADSAGNTLKDTVISYAGCGCAGGQITTVSGPVADAVDARGTPQTGKRRTQKSYDDILGRTYKTEIWDLDGAGSNPYSKVETTFNGIDQAVSIAETDVANSITRTTTMTYDGHERLASKHIPQQDTSTATTYNYNADDSISSVTDARGSSTNYSYNSRGLVTNIGWSVPGRSGITAPSSVAMSYDYVGNRTEMTDGMGTQNYTYDSLSRLTSETRHLTDYLRAAPEASNSFKIDYEYSLGGQLKVLRSHMALRLITRWTKLADLARLPLLHLLEVRLHLPLMPNIPRSER